MKVLVTGGSGFIGSAVCRHFVHELGWQVINVDCLTYAAAPGTMRAVEDNPAYHFEKGDICDSRFLHQSFEKHKPDAVLHLAAESHVDRSIDGPVAFVNTNVVGTVQMLEAARRYLSNSPQSVCNNFRFHHVSTDEVYGSLPTDAGYFTETTPYAPSSPYSASKAASDHMARAWHRTYGLPVLLTNCSNNYGPFQFPEKLIPLMIIRALAGLSLPVYGKGANVRDWLHVEDHARALGLVLAHGRVGETYNIGGDAEYSNLSVVEAICDLVDVHLGNSKKTSRKQIVFVEDRPGHDMRYAIDASKIQTELGWKPQVTFAEGIGRTVRWYIENDWWWRQILHTHSTERLGQL